MNAGDRLFTKIPNPALPHVPARTTLAINGPIPMAAHICDAAGILRIKTPILNLPLPTRPICAKNVLTQGSKYTKVYQPVPSKICCNLLVVDVIARIGRSYRKCLGRIANDALSQTELPTLCNLIFYNDL